MLQDHRTYKKQENTHAFSLMRRRRLWADCVSTVVGCLSPACRFAFLFSPGLLSLELAMCNNGGAPKDHKSRLLSLREKSRRKRLLPTATA